MEIQNDDDALRDRLNTANEALSVASDTLGDIPYAGPLITAAADTFDIFCSASSDCGPDPIDYD